VRLELSRRNSLQKAPVSTVKPNRDLTPSSSWSAHTSDVEIVAPTPSASSSSLGLLYKHLGRPVPTVEGKRYCKHARRSTAQHFAAHDSSSGPSSPISVSEISRCSHSGSPSSTAHRFAAHDLSSAPSSPIPISEISQRFTLHDSSSVPSSPISVSEISWHPHSDSPSSLLASSSSLPAVTCFPLPTDLVPCLSNCHPQLHCHL